MDVNSYPSLLIKALIASAEEAIQQALLQKITINEVKKKIDIAIQHIYMSMEEGKKKNFDPWLMCYVDMLNKNYDQLEKKILGKPKTENDALFGFMDSLLKKQLSKIRKNYVPPETVSRYEAIQNEEKRLKYIENKHFGGNFGEYLENCVIDRANAIIKHKKEQEQIRTELRRILKEQEMIEVKNTKKGKKEEKKHATATKKEEKKKSPERKNKTSQPIQTSQTSDDYDDDDDCMYVDDRERKRSQS
jgi:hypothetical protein